MISLRQHNEWRAWIAAWEVTWVVIAQHMINFGGSDRPYRRAWLEFAT